MLSTTQKIHTSISTPENFSIHLVSPHADDLEALRHILHHSDWKIARMDGCREAAKHLTENASSIVICERDLPDGNWKDILHQISQLPNPPMLLVMCRHADENLWADVLSMGGYDVLLKPFDNREVTRIVGMAWRHWSSTLTGKKASSAIASNASHSSYSMALSAS
jgi:Response regulator containing CheY-like receiver, AAA-type ATPase, and DNA-binding domains